MVLLSVTQKEMPMTILLNNIGKKYNKQWIFKDLNYTFENGSCTAILGNNGSGKSTLIQCIIGAILLSNGVINYSINNEKITDQKIFQHISFASPYLELIEELTLLEMVQFHQKFKPLYANFTAKTVADIVGLNDALLKPIAQFSSGMKQRLKLALSFFSQSHLLCLDEPLSNLDKKGFEMYKELIDNYLFNRTVIISSNDANETSFCTSKIELQNYK